MRPGTPGFIGDRLRESREARAMTAISLSDIVGVDRSAISQYEHGHQSPSPQVLRKISEALNVPVQRFIRKIPHRNHGPIFFRCMSSATKRARLRAKRRYEWLVDISQFVAQYVKFPDVRFPQFDLPTDPTQIGIEQVDEIAAEARKFWELGEGPVSNIVWLLENNGVILSRSPLEATTLDAFSEWGIEHNRPYVVLASDKNSAVRSRYDAAHELGHLLLHRKILSAALNQSDSFALIESQAHRFASAFLMPEASFADSLFAVSIDSFRVLKERWRVSIAAMIMRSAELRLINDEQQKRLWMNLGRRKWRTREPLDDSLEVERPRLLRRCMEMLLERRVIGQNDVPFQLGISSTDVEQLAGLNPGALGDSGASMDLEGSDPNPPDDADNMIVRFPRAS